jgi:hypothetical protein
MGKYKKRSVSKELVNYTAALGGGASYKAQIFPSSGSGVTFPCIISGVRLIGTAQPTIFLGSGSFVFHFWAVAIQRQGEALPTSIVVYAGDQTILTPEEDIIIWGAGDIICNPSGKSAIFRHYEVAGTTKRKLMIGDSLMLWSFIDNDFDVTYNFTIQFFVLI